MDWLRYQLWAVIWVITCITKSEPQTRKKEPECVSGEHIPKPDMCNDCICYEGEIHCTNLPTCRARQKELTGPECVEGQPVIKPDECNECYCIDGKLDCSDLICIRGSKCSEGQQIPDPDRCNVCKCFEGHILCTNYQCPSRPELSEEEDTIPDLTPIAECNEGDYIPPPPPPNECNNCSCVNQRILCTIENCTNILEADDTTPGLTPLPECEEGDYIPPPLPPNDCNNCSCVNQRILCTIENCTKSEPDETRFKELNVRNSNHENDDNQISVDPFITIFYKNYDKTPTKLIHTHAYNRFHQEIKVHSTHLPKDATQIIKALANTLDKHTLSDISNKLKGSSSLGSPINSNVKSSFVPLKNQNYTPFLTVRDVDVITKNVADISDIHVSHSMSSSSITGSQSNETILFLPNSKTYVSQHIEEHVPDWNSHSVQHKFYPKFHKIIPYKSESANFTFNEKRDEYISSYPFSSSVNQSVQNQSNIYPATYNRITDLSGLDPDLPINQNKDESRIDEFQPLDSNLTTEPFNNNHISEFTFGQEQPNMQEYFSSSTFSQNPSLYNNEFSLPSSNFSLESFHDGPIEKPDQEQSTSTILKNISSRFLLEPNSKIHNTNQNSPPRGRHEVMLISHKPNSIIQGGINQYKPHSTITYTTKTNKYSIPQTNEEQVDENNDFYNTTHYKLHTTITTTITQTHDGFPSDQEKNITSTLNSKPGVSDDRSSSGGFQYIYSSDEDNIIQNHTKSEDLLHQPKTGNFDERGSADGYQYISNSDEDLITPKNKELLLHQPMIFNDSGNLDLEIQPKFGGVLDHPSQNSIEEGLDVSSDKGQIIPKNSTTEIKSAQLFEIPLHTPKTELFDVNGTPNSLQYTSGNVQDPRLQKRAQVQMNLSKPLPKTGIIEDTIISKNNYYTPNQTNPVPESVSSRGVFNNRPSDEFSAGKPTVPNFNQPHQIPFQFPPHQSKTGVFDNRGAPNDLHYISNSFQEPRFNKHPQYQIQSTQYQPNTVIPQYQIQSTQYQPNTVISNTHGSPDGLQYMSNTPKNFTISQNNQFQPNQIQTFRFQNQPNSAGYPTIPNVKKNPQFSIHEPSHRFQNISNSAGYPSTTKNLPQSFQHFSSLPKTGKDPIFDKRPHFQVSIPSQHKSVEYKPVKSQFILPQNYPKPAVFENNASPDKFLYITNSVGHPSVPNVIKPLQHRFQISTNVPKSGEFDPNWSPHASHDRSISVQDPRLNNDPYIQINPAQQGPKMPNMNEYKPPPPQYQISLPSQQYRPEHPQPQPQQPQLYLPQNGFQPEVIYNQGTLAEFPHTFNSDEHPSMPNFNKPPKSPFQLSPHLPQTGILNASGIPHGPHYISDSVLDPVLNKHPHFPLNITQHQPKRAVMNDREPSHVYPTHQLSQSFPHQQNRPYQSQLLVLPNSPNPGVFDERPSSDRFQYISNTGKDTTIPKVSQPKPWPISDHDDPKKLFPKPINEFQIFKTQPHYQSRQNSSETTMVPKFPKDYPNKNNYDSVIPHNNLDFNIFKPSSTDNLLLLPDVNEKKISFNKDTLSANPAQDQYKPMSDDNFFKEIHNIHLPLPKENINVMNSNVNLTTPRYILKPEHDQYKPSSVDYLQNGIHQIPWSFPKEDTSKLSYNEGPSIVRPSQYNRPLKDQPLYNSNPNIVTPKDTTTTTLDASDSIPLKSRLKTDKEKEYLFTLDDVKIPNYDHEINPLLLKAKDSKTSPPLKLTDLTTNNLDPLELLPLLSKMTENSKLKQSPDQDLSVDDEILNLLISNQGHINPTEYNITMTNDQPSDSQSGQEVDSDEVHTYFSEFSQPFIKTVSIVQDSPYDTYDPESIKIKKVTTAHSYVESETSHENQSHLQVQVPTTSEENSLQSPSVEHSDVHITLKPNKGGDKKKSQILETDAYSKFSEVDEERYPHSLSKLLHSRYRYRPKDQKEECGEGTEWIRNCHDCSCRGGKALCNQLPDCVLRPFGEVMMCKPYTHFKMEDCYICECSGDGVAECDATECKSETSGEAMTRDSKELKNKDFTTFYDVKKTRILLEYYGLHKKLPIDVPRKTMYPTCESGTTWISSCHECKCNDVGKHVCTKMKDCELDIKLYGKPTRCKPNSKFYPKSTGMPCVECTCDDEGNPYCPVPGYKKN